MNSIAQNCEKIKTHTYAKRQSAKKKLDNALKWARFAPVGCPLAKVILLTLAGLRSSRGIATVSHAEIATFAECSVMTVRRKLIQLEAADYIKRYRRHNKRGQRASDSYFLATHLKDLEPIKPLKRVVKQTAKQTTQSVPGMMNQTFQTGSIPSVPQRNEHTTILRSAKCLPQKNVPSLPGLPSIALVSSFGSISHASTLASRLKLAVSCVPSRQGGQR